MRPVISAEYDCNSGLIRLSDYTSWTTGWWNSFQNYGYIKILLNGVTATFYNASGSPVTNIAFSSVFTSQGMQNVVLGYLPGYSNVNITIVIGWTTGGEDRIGLRINLFSNCGSIDCIKKKMCEGCCNDKPCKKCSDKKNLLLLGLIGYEALLKCGDSRAQKLMDKINALCKLQKKCC